MKHEGLLDATPIPPELYEEFKKACRKNKQAMAPVMCSMMERYINRQKVKKWSKSPVGHSKVFVYGEDLHKWLPFLDEKCEVYDDMEAPVRWGCWNPDKLYADRVYGVEIKEEE